MVQDILNAAGSIPDWLHGGDVSADIPGLGKLDSEQLTNLQKADKVAKKYGLPEFQFIKLLFHEGSLKNNPGGNGGGIGQFINTTAEQYGYTQEQLRNNPDIGIELAARLLKDNAGILSQGLTKPIDISSPQGFQLAAASYFIGPANVKQAIITGKDNWLDEADKIAKQYNQGSVTDYLKNVGAGDVGTPNLGGKPLSSASSSTNSSTRRSPMDQPDPNDPYYQIKNPDGTIGFDRTTFGKDMLTYSETQKNLQDVKSGPLASMINEIINDQTNRIASGKLSVEKANDELTVRVNTFKNATDFLSSKAYGYGSPVGAEYLSGHSPTDYATTKLGMAPIKIPTGSAVVDPLAEALATQNQAKDMFGAINVPSGSIGDIQGMYKNALGSVPGQQSSPNYAGTNTPIAGGATAPNQDLLTAALAIYNRDKNNTPNYNQGMVP